MKSAERDKALELRINHQLGYGTIAKRVKVSKGTLSRWLKDLPLSPKRVLELRREAWGRGEASRERFRQTMRAKREKREAEVYQIQLRKFRTISSQSLFVAGLMLYLAEGDKKNYGQIGFSNTDPWTISFFVWWLKRFLKVKEKKIKVQLHLYESMDIKAEQKFWQHELSFDSSHFYRHQVRPLRPASFSYRESFRHGTCKVYVHSVKQKTELMLAIKAFLDRYSGC